MGNIVILADVRDGKIKKPTLEAVGAGVELAGKAGGDVIVIACGANLGGATEELSKSGAKKVVSIDSPDLANYSGDGYATAILGQLGGLDASAVLMANTAMGRDLLPRIAAKLDAGMVSDCTALHFEDGKFGATKPVFAGKAYKKSMATSTPFVASLRPNNFEAGSGDGAEVVSADAGVGAADLKAIVKEVVTAASDRVPLQEAGVVVSGGRGLKEPENFNIIEDLAAAFGPGVAAVGASRAVVDAGWRPHREQVGQTGKVVSPTLYIAVAVSGAIQHLAGMRTSRFIVAINKDENAPIFKVADYGIVGDAFEIVPALTEAVKAAVAE